MEAHDFVTLLPEFKGYTIDGRLEQFRRFRPNKLPEFIEFRSTKGIALLNDLLMAKPKPLFNLPEGKELAGTYLGYFPVNYPLDNAHYIQAALKVGEQHVLVTMTHAYIDKLKMGQFVTLKGTKHGIEMIVKENQLKQTPKLKP